MRVFRDRYASAPQPRLPKSQLNFQMLVARHRAAKSNMLDMEIIDAESKKKCQYVAEMDKIEYK
jgi:hypothetical protein